MKKPVAILISLFTTVLIAVSCSPDSDTHSTVKAAASPVQKTAAEPTDDLAEQVAKMGAIGYSYGGEFSPDGNTIAFITNASGVPNVWLADADGGNLRQLTKSEDQVAGFTWNQSNDTMALQIAPGGGLNTQLYMMPASGGELQMITAGGDVNNWLGEWSEDGRFLSFSSSAESENGMDCWLHDTETGENRLIVKNNGIGTCALSPDNRYAGVWRMVSRGNTDLYLVDMQSGEEQHITPHVGVALSQGFDFLDNDTLLFITNIDRETLALAKIDIADGQAGSVEVLHGRDDAVLSGYEILGTDRLLLSWNVAGKSELEWFEVSTGATSPGPESPAELVGGAVASKDGKQLVITTSGSISPTNVWRLDPVSEAFTQISQTPHEGVDLESLVSPVLKTYTAHDGLELSGWYYEPKVGSDGRIVLSFHGGPEGQSRPSFRATFQALLSRGIAVFDPNVRGSAGFGKTFVNLDNGALRFDGIKDIESTVKFVTEAGLADPERIGIMGGSYGGYMVMAGITEYPDMFAAGANLFGIVNFETFFAQTEPWMAAISTVEYGDPATEAELLQQLSPIHKIDQIVTPTIVLHGANDTNVPVVEAEQVVENLEARGVPVKYVLFEDEGHGWGKVVNRITSDVEIVRWFEGNL